MGARWESAALRIMGKQVSIVSHIPCMNISVVFITDLHSSL